MPNKRELAPMLEREIIATRVCEVLRTNEHAGVFTSSWTNFVCGFPKIMLNTNNEDMTVTFLDDKIELCVWSRDDGVHEIGIEYEQTNLIDKIVDEVMRITSGNFYRLVD